MRRILVLTPQLPYPPWQGTSLRNWHNLLAMAGNSDLSLLSFTEVTPAYIPDKLRAICNLVEVVPVAPRPNSTRIRQMLRTGLPDLALRLDSPAFTITLKRLLRTNQYDAVQIEGLELAMILPVVRDIRPDIPIVLDNHNIETVLQQRAYQADIRHPVRWPAAFYSRVQAGRLFAFERDALEAADRIITVSESDADMLRKLFGSETGSAISVIPNSIDVGSYAVTKPVSSEFRNDLIFTGKMDYRPNIDAVNWFSTEVWPLLKTRYPSLTWSIVGQKPHQRVLALKSEPGIIVTGKVEQIQPYLGGSSIFVMPLRIGSGTRLKLMEAMAAGSAVVTTPLGAEGLPVVDGEHVLLADSANEFRTNVQRLLDDRPFRKKLASRAMKLAEIYDWRNNITRFQKLYDSL